MKSTRCPHCGGGWKGVSRKHVKRCARRARVRAEQALPGKMKRGRRSPEPATSSSPPGYHDAYAALQKHRNRRGAADRSGPITEAGRAFVAVANAEASAIHRSVAESGGYTGSIRDAKPVLSGCVINHVGVCPTLPVDASADNIRDCLVRNADWFTENGNGHFGLWRDPDRGVLVLDRVTVAPNIESATRIATERRQRAFYDLTTGKTHNLTA